MSEAPSRREGSIVVAFVAALILANGVLGYFLAWRHGGGEVTAPASPSRGPLLEARRALARAARPETTPAERARWIARATESLALAEGEGQRVDHIRARLLDPAPAAQLDAPGLRRVVDELDSLLDGQGLDGQVRGSEGIDQDGVAQRGR